MNEHEVLFSILRRANPVPHPEALLGAPDSTVREPTLERNPTMSTTPVIIEFESRAPATRRRSRLAIAAAVLVIVAGVFVVLRPTAEVAAPTEVSTAFFEAINENNSDAWWGLHSDDALVFGESIGDEAVRQGYQDYFDWRTTVKSRFEEVSCVETGGLDTATGGTAIRCNYVWRGAIQDRVGVSLTGYMLMAVDEGKIVNISVDSPDFGPMRDAPVHYLSEQHPDEFAALCGAGPGAFNGGAECAQLYMDNLDGIAEVWQRQGG